MNYTQHGFEYTGTCNCDGTTTEKYKNGIWQIRHRPKAGLFKFKKHGQSVTTWMSEQHAEEYIKINIPHVAV